MSELKPIGDSIRAGQVVYLDERGKLMPFVPPMTECQPLGTALRDIAKGEVVVYSPGHSTDDIEAVVYMR